MLPSDFKEQVRSQTDLVALIGESLALQPRKGGREYVGLCPFHDDKHPSFDVDPRRQRFKCWACGKHGDVISFVQEFEKNGTPQTTGAIQLNSTDGASVQTSNSAISIDLNNNYFIGFQTASNSNDIDAVFGNLL